MTIPGFIARNAFRNKRRLMLTVLSVALSLFLFVTLRTALKLMRSVSVTVEDCDTRSDRLRAASVTLRLAATPEENSTVPKNSVSINGTTKANSTAALARRSRTKRPSALQAR